MTIRRHEENLTAADFRRLAAEQHQRRQDSLDRSDTDGCVSQAGYDLNAREYEAKAKLLENGKRGRFTGLYQNGRRVKAKQIETQYGHSWVVHPSETEIISRRGKQYLPTGKTSRILRQLGLEERPELAPAWAGISANGTGTAGLASASIVVYRTGDEWGQDAVLAQGPEL